MPRIRTVKPEFWGDEKLSPLADATRLIFLGLISMADDAGRIVDSEKQIEAFIFPIGDHSRAVREGLASLARAGRVARGMTASGQAVLQIVHWARHQRVDHPNLKACLPEIVHPQDLTLFREDVATDSRAVPEGFAPRPTTNDQRPVPSTDEDEDEPTSAISGIPTDLIGWLPVEYHPDLEGAYRASRSPVALLAEIRVLRDHPDLRNLAGVTGAHVGEAIRDAALKGAQLSGRTLRGFVQKAQQAPQRPGGATSGAGAVPGVHLAPREARMADTLTQFVERHRGDQ